MIKDLDRTEDCPDWCVMHLADGTCVGEFTGPGDIGDGFHVYARSVEDPDGIGGVEIAIAQDGGDITRVTVTADAG